MSDDECLSVIRNVRWKSGDFFRLAIHRFVDACATLWTADDVINENNDNNEDTQHLVQFVYCLHYRNTLLTI